MEDGRRSSGTDPVAARRGAAKAANRHTEGPSRSPRGEPAGLSEHINPRLRAATAVPGGNEGGKARRHDTARDGAADGALQPV